MSNCKVLFVHDGPVLKTDDGAYYGVHVNDKLIQRYKYLGNQVTLLMRTMRIDQSAVKQFSRLSMDGVKVIEIPDFKSVRLFLKNYRSAKRVINSAVEDHDIVVSRLPSASGRLAALDALKLHKPIIAEFVACTFDAYWNYNWKGKLIAHYKKWQQQRLVRKLPYVIYVTNEFLQGRYPSAAKQVNCSNVELTVVNVESLNSRLEKIDTYSRCTVYKLGTVAAIDVPFKGQADVIRAIGKLKKKGYRFQYLIVGQGNPAYLERIIREEDVVDLVEIVGALKHNEVFNFLDNIDLYIQPSKQEGLPRALIEAMSRACPSLGARTAGIPELLDPSFIFQAGNINAIAEKLLNLDHDMLKTQAIRNFSESQKYQKDILEKRRKDFYDAFLQDVGLK